VALRVQQTEIVHPNPLVLLRIVEEQLQWATVEPVAGADQPSVEVDILVLPTLAPRQVVGAPYAAVRWPEAATIATEPARLATRSPWGRTSIRAARSTPLRRKPARPPEQRQGESGTTNVLRIAIACLDRSRSHSISLRSCRPGAGRTASGAGCQPRQRQYHEG
jgi:hypothetical protein